MSTETATRDDFNRLTDTVSAGLKELSGSVGSMDVVVGKMTVELNNNTDVTERMRGAIEGTPTSLGLKQQVAEIQGDVDTFKRTRRYAFLAVSTVVVPVGIALFVMFW